MMPSLFVRFSASDLEKKVENYLKELAEETDSVRKSKFFQEYLDTIAKFWNYSFHNQILIFLQCPQASRIAGFIAWNKLERNVKTGEKAIKILAPFTKKIVKKNENQEEKEILFTYFVPVNVFDVSQTTGKELPKINIEIQGNTHKELLDKLLAFCKKQNIIVEFKELGINGLYGYSQGGKIILSNNQSTNMQVNTVIHEIAHELIHYSPEAKNFSKQEKETQAESTAYVVCKFFGLETKSPKYLAFYKADYERIMQNLKIVNQTSKIIVDFLHGERN